MANNDPSKIRFAPNGAVYLAPAVGAELPTAVGDGKTPPTGFKSLGYTSDSGVVITPTITADPVNVWQSAVPVLFNVSAATFTIQCTFVETNVNTTELFWGANWVAVTPEGGGTANTWRLDLSSTPDLQEISLVVDWGQGGMLSRAVIPRSMVQDRGAITLVRTAPQEYQLTIDALDSGGLLGYVLTNQDMTST
ncbi:MULTISPECIES: phage tail tube protein [unclassified Streptomyces]|uniref:phage tail tube protein n=1 Tax=unclassified Streptomyces TaxID=2593676 RepID=UPI00342A91A9